LWQVEQQERVEFTYIVFTGSAESLSAMLGGHINLEAMSLFPTKIPYLKEGKLRIIAYITKQKMTDYENIPSLEELYGVVAPSFMGVWGPHGLPNYVLEKLDDAFAKGVKDPNFIDVMNRMYTPVVYMNRAEVNKEVREKFQKTGQKLKILRAEETKEKK
jgi:tripartite-type tricarboxylate transporter receptor subunit TctC